MHWEHVCKHWTWRDQRGHHLYTNVDNCWCLASSHSWLWNLIWVIINYFIIYLPLLSLLFLGCISYQHFLSFLFFLLPFLPFFLSNMAWGRRYHLGIKSWDCSYRQLLSVTSTNDRCLMTTCKFSTMGYNTSSLHRHIHNVYSHPYTHKNI